MSAVKLDDARRVISAAEKKAREIGQPMNIAVLSLYEAQISALAILSQPRKRRDPQITQITQIRTAAT